MSKDNKTPTQQDRLAQALRDNLRRRKQAKTARPKSPEMGLPDLKHPINKCK